MMLGMSLPIAARFTVPGIAVPFAIGGEPRAFGFRWHRGEPRAVLVLLHGLQSHSGWFGEAATLLQERGFAVYALDRRGSGASPGRKGDIRDYREWLREVALVVRQAREEYPGRSVHLIGHCFGANIATGYALLRPGRIASIVMLTPGFFVRPDYSLAEKAAIAAAAVIAPTTTFHVPQDDDLFTRDPEVLAWINADTLGAKRMTARALMQINRMLRWLRRNAGRVDVPVLVLEAARDRLSDNERNRAFIAETFGDRARWKTFGAEHFLLSEPVRDEVLDAIEAWVGGDN